MQLHPSSCYLFFATNFVFFASCLSGRNHLVDDVIDNEVGVRLQEEDRWQREIEAFRKGLNIKNDQGEVFELTLEESPVKILSLTNEVSFHLYTRKNPTESQKLTMDSPSSVENWKSTNYDVGKPTYFIVHGWKSSGIAQSCTLVRDAYLRSNDFNVVVVDWSSIAGQSYLSAAQQVPSVGKQVARMIDFLSINAELSPNQTYLVGHSLGAHIMGVAGYHRNGAINTIYGLDPALPLFVFAGRGSRLDSSDAAHVQIIHTNSGLLGYMKPIGTSDFHPNGGLFQSGCGIMDITCSHSRAYELFAESINSWKGFWGRLCTRFEFLFHLCKMPLQAKMGGIEVQPGLSGNFYLRTNGERPYAIGFET